MTQAGGNTLRLGSSPLVGPPARVTYLVPSLPPGMVVTPREAGPRLATGSGAQPMQTILLRMASPQGGFTTVPGGTIAVPANLMPANASGSPTGTPAGATTMMVATATGSQVRMVRAPPPMTLPRGGATLTLPPGTTLVRAPMASNMRPGVPQQMSVVRPPVPTASTPATPTTLSLPPKPTLQVQVPGAGGSTPVRLPQPPLQVQVPISGASGTGAVRPAKLDGNVSLIKTQHPASLPPTPRYIDDPKKKRLPPKPALKITKAASGEKGLVLSWNMTFNTLYADIQTYQLYAYQETNSPPATSHWKKVGDVRALPLPMACTLTQFIEGHKYHFAVRAVDVHNRLGPFSDPSSILL